MLSAKVHNQCANPIQVKQFARVMTSPTMAPTITDEDNQLEREISAVKDLKKETIPSQPNQAVATSQSRLSHTPLDESYSAPKSFNTSASSLDVLSSSSAPMIFPARNRKRNSNGEIKQMVAELNARADLAMSRERTATPESRRYGHDLPSTGHRGNDWDWEIFREYPAVMSYSPRSPKTPRNTSLMDRGSKDVEEENEQEDNPRKHKRQGSLLEWRNKEMFEEPVRV